MRELYIKHDGSLVDMLFAYALEHGIISHESVLPELEPYLERPLAFYRGVEQSDEEG